MSDEYTFHALFKMGTQVSVMVSSTAGGTEVLSGPLMMANQWGLAIELGTRPKPTFLPWHRVLQVTT